MLYIYGSQIAEEGYDLVMADGNAHTEATTKRETRQSKIVSKEAENAGESREGLTNLNKAGVVIAAVGVILVIGIMAAVVAYTSSTTETLPRSDFAVLRFENGTYTMVVNETELPNVQLPIHDAMPTGILGEDDDDDDDEDDSHSKETEHIVKISTGMMSVDD